MSAAGLDARVVVRRDGFVLDASIAVEPGTTAALLGPNGAGKSTVVDAIAGLIALDDGVLRLGARVLDDPGNGVFVPPPDRRVGVVFQQYLLFDHLDVLDNVAFGPAAAGLSRRQAREAAAPWLSLFDLEDLAGRRPPDLSGGQAQRVAMARALAIDPLLVALDEPFAALDVEGRVTLRRAVREVLDRTAGPRLLITHDPAEAFLLADRIHVLEQGRVTQVGTPEEIRSRPRTPYAAALAGVNLLAGRNDGGRLSLADSDLQLTTADIHTTGPVLITIHPSGVAIHLTQPHGSPRNAWQTELVAVEPLGEITRLTLAAPHGLAADVTPASVTAMGLRAGQRVWASVKATEVDVRPA